MTINAYYNKIKGKSWASAKIIVKRTMIEEVNACPEWHASEATNALVALEKYHGELYGVGLCDVDRVAKYLREEI